MTFPAGFLSDLGLALLILRQRAGLSVAALAARASVGSSQVSDYENGKGNPKLKTLLKIAEALEVEPFSLFYLAQLLQHSGSRERLGVELVLGGVASAAASGEEAPAFRKVMASLLELHQVVVERLVAHAHEAAERKKESWQETAAGRATRPRRPHARAGR